MASLAEKLAASENQMLAGFGRYCAEQRMDDSATEAHLQKAAAAFPGLHEKLAFGGLLRGAAGMLGKVGPGLLNAGKQVGGAALGAVKAAPGLAANAFKAAPGMAAGAADAVKAAPGRAMGALKAAPGQAMAGLRGAAPNMALPAVTGAIGGYGADPHAGLSSAVSGAAMGAAMGAGGGHPAARGAYGLLGGMAGPAARDVTYNAAGAAQAQLEGVNRDGQATTGPGILRAPSAAATPPATPPAAPTIAPAAPPAGGPQPTQMPGAMDFLQNPAGAIQQAMSAGQDGASSMMMNALKDPKAQAALQQHLATSEGTMLEALKSGTQPSIEQVTELLSGKAVMSAAKSGQNPQELFQNAKATAQKFLQDGQLSQQEMGQLVQSDAGQQFVHEMQQQTGATNPQDLWGGIQQWAQENPMQMAGLMIGLPLMLMGAMNTMGGEGGLGSLMAALLGGGAVAYGMGAFGGTQGQGLGSMLGQAMGMGGGAQAAPGQPAAPGAAGPADAAAPANVPPGSNLAAAMQNPQQMFQQLQQRAQGGDKQAAQLLQILDTPAEAQQFVQQYAQNPDAARQYLQQAAPMMHPARMFGIPNQHWQTLQEQMQAPYSGG